MLYIMQHADAVEKDVDPMRPISEKGRIDTQLIANFLTAKRLLIDKVWHSTKLRSRQTAELLHDILSLSVPLVERKELEPDYSAKKLKKIIDKENENLLIVGHLPQLAQLIGLILCGDENQQPVKFQKGGILKLDRSENDQWQIVWFVTPELLK